MREYVTVTNGPATVEVILDSISPDGIRLTTLHARYPRMIHAEVMTHRMFSRNARSSRAVPSSRLRAEDIYVPRFAHNQKGMRAAGLLSDEEQRRAEEIWNIMALGCQYGSEQLSSPDDLNVHKQWTNRPLEFFGYIDVLISSTKWNNFLALRTDGAAQPEMQSLAWAVKDALEQSRPEDVLHDWWHLPYIEADDWAESAGGSDLNYQQNVLCRVSAARCARISYAPFEGANGILADLERFEKLMNSGLIHASPMEHQATPDEEDLIEGRWVHPTQHGNFHGWRQFRKMIPGEAVEE